MIALAAVFALTLSSVSQIEVRAGWMALSGDPQQYVARISGDGSQFASDAVYRYGMPVDRDGAPQGHSSSSTGTVPTERVERLLAALGDTVKPSPVAADFGFNQTWLDNHAAAAFSSFAGDAGHGFYTPAQRRLYVSSFQNPSVVSAALATYYQRSPEPTDQGIYVTIRVELNDKRQVVIESQRHQMLMLPWSVTGEHQTYTTFDPALSAAIAVLLPDNLVARDRLSFSPLLNALPSLVGAQIKPQWDKLPSYDLAPTIRALETRYRVQIEASGWGSGSSVTAWPAGLKWNDLPSNLSAVVDLAVVNNSFTSTAGISAARSYAVTLDGIPWVRAVLEKRSDVTARIGIEEPGSLGLSPRQRAEFRADLAAIGRPDLIEKVRPVLSTAFSVIFEEPNYFSEWVVLPDRTMVLWHYFNGRPTKSILDLPSDALRGKACANDNALLCSGLERHPDGTEETQ